MRTRSSLLLLLAALVVSSCGSSHKAATTRAVRTETKRTVAHRPATTRAVRTETKRAVAHRPESFNLALISARTGALLHVSAYDVPSGVAQLDVKSAVADGRDGWFVSGGFGLAHMLQNGKLDSSWGTKESRGFEGGTLIKTRSRLYVLTTRTVALPAGSSHQASDVEAFDVRTGERLWASPDPSQRVNALAASSTRVYLGGAFTSVGNARRQGLAALDASTGRLLEWRAPPLRGGSAGSPLVSALSLAGSSLYVGGYFNSIGGSRRNYLAALDPSSGDLLPWKPPEAATRGGDAPIEIVVTGDRLIISNDNSSAFSLRTGREPSWARGIGGKDRALTVDGSLLYVGANIESPMGLADGEGRYNLAALDLSSGRFTNWAPYLGVDYVSVSQIVPSGGRVLVLGMFTNNIG